MQACFVEANRWRAPLYPTSRGRSWGFGSRVAVRDGSVLLDLGRMNRIVEVNEELSRTPELVNQDPYGKGWMFKVKMADLPELGELMTPSDYAAHIGE